MGGPTRPTLNSVRLSPPAPLKFGYALVHLYSKKKKIQQSLESVRLDCNDRSHTLVKVYTTAQCIKIYPADTQSNRHQWGRITKMFMYRLCFTANFCFHWNFDNFLLEGKTNTSKWSISHNGSTHHKFTLVHTMFLMILFLEMCQHFSPHIK